MDGRRSGFIAAKDIRGAARGERGHELTLNTPPVFTQTRERERGKDYRLNRCSVFNCSSQLSLPSLRPRARRGLEVRLG